MRFEEYLENCVLRNELPKNFDDITERLKSDENLAHLYRRGKEAIAASVYLDPVKKFFVTGKVRAPEPWEFQTLESETVFYRERLSDVNLTFHLCNTLYT